MTSQLVEEEQRVERVIRVLQEARVWRVRVKVDCAIFGARLAGLPAGVVLETDRVPRRKRTPPVTHECADRNHRYTGQWLEEAA
jgi:hypothetical protein